MKINHKVTSWAVLLSDLESQFQICTKAWADCSSGHICFKTIICWLSHVPLNLNSDGSMLARDFVAA